MANRKWQVPAMAAALFVALAVILGVSIGVPLAKRSATNDQEHAEMILQQVPLIDGHNDLAWQYFNNAKNKISDVPLDGNLTAHWGTTPPSDIYPQTDIPRLRAGRVGAQFWAAFVHCKTEKHDAVRLTLQQIDVIKRFVQKYPEILQFVTSAKGIREAFEDGKIGSLIGVEGGHSIDNDLATLRLFYELGVRYMTLTHSCNIPWADNWKVSNGADTPVANGLTDFGKTVVKEMNRLGMMVDLSHVAFTTMSDALDVAVAPVIFSHSSAYSVCNSTRNVPDDILQRVKDNGGVVMVNFYPGYISCNSSYATVAQVADHIDYIKNLIGADYVGIGADYDGVPVMPEGLEDVATYPDLFAELVRRGWSDEDLKKLAGENLLRAFERVEQVRDNLASTAPYDDWIPETDVQDYTCRSTFQRAKGKV